MSAIATLPVTTQGIFAYTFKFHVAGTISNCQTAETESSLTSGTPDEAANDAGGSSEAAAGC